MEDNPYGARRYLRRPKGVMKVVYTIDSLHLVGIGGIPWLRTEL